MTSSPSGMGMPLRRTEDAFHNSDKPLIVSATAPAGVFAASPASTDRRIGASSSIDAETANAGKGSPKRIAIVRVLIMVPVY